MRIEQFREQVFKQSEITGDKKVPVVDRENTIYGSVVDNQVWIDVGSPGVIIRSFNQFWLRQNSNNNE